MTPKKVSQMEVGMQEVEVTVPVEEWQAGAKCPTASKQPLSLHEMLK